MQEDVEGTREKGCESADGRKIEVYNAASTLYTSVCSHAKFSSLHKPFPVPVFV